MKTIKLSEIPAPYLSDGTIAIRIVDPMVKNIVLAKCEELGWLWMNGYRSTDPYCAGHLFEWLTLGQVKEQYNRLYYSFVVPIGMIGFIVDIEQKVEIKYFSNIDLKTVNSVSSATNCASCGGQLKEPYPGLKHCSKCEP